MLTYVCFFPVNGKFLAEAGKRFGTDNTMVLYNGAYIMDEFEPQSSRELVKNERYWDKDNVFINRLRYKYNKESTTLGPELFLRGDVSGLEEPLPVNIMDSWMKDPAKKAQIHPAQVNTFSYFYCLNFVPKFEAQYNPDNWKVVVNNKAFRESLFHALDRRVAMVTSEPFQPERRLMTTVTPRNFVSAGGKDFVDMPALASIAKTESFNKTLALKYKAQALKELAGKATFPVKMPMPYNASQTDWVNRVQVVEQQMEGLLGKDYIDIIPVSYPATGFLDKTRRPGFYAMQECRWGPDYADPQTYTDPFVAGTTYNRPEFAVGYTDKNGKPMYDNLVATAVAEVKDLKKRYELFAKAEAFLINEAFIIPYGVGGRRLRGHPSRALQQSLRALRRIELQVQGAHGPPERGARRPVSEARSRLAEGAERRHRQGQVGARPFPGLGKKSTRERGNRLVPWCFAMFYEKRVVPLLRRTIFLDLGLTLPAFQGDSSRRKGA